MERDKNCFLDEKYTLRDRLPGNWANLSLGQLTRLPLDGLNQRGQGENGAFCRCFPCEVTTGSVDMIAVKVHAYGDNLDEMLKIINEDRKEYERLKGGIMGPYVTKSNFLIGNVNDDKLAYQVVVQKWIKGMTVGRMTVDEIAQNPKLLFALRAFGRRVVINWIRTGYLVDYWGCGIKPESSFVLKIRVAALRSSRNLIWDGENLNLVDTTKHPILAAKRKWGKFGELVKVTLGIGGDFFWIDKKIGRQELSANEEMMLGFAKCLTEVVERLEKMRKEYGLDYRVVGGVAMASIEGKQLGPIRNDSTKRDLDVIILNPGVCPEELKKLQDWCKEYQEISGCFPEISLKKVGTERDFGLKRKGGFLSCLPFFWQFQDEFCKDEKGCYFQYGDLTCRIPSEALKETRLFYYGVDFCSFPKWFLLLLCKTRNGGIIKEKDKYLMSLLDQTVEPDETVSNFNQQIDIYLEEIRKRYGRQRWMNWFRLKYCSKMLYQLKSIRDLIDHFRRKI